IVGRDAGGDAFAGLDRHREGGLHPRLVLRGHQVEAELRAALRGEREADESARLLGHEVDRLGRHELRRHHDVALVLAVLVVADDDHPAQANLLDRLLDRRERAPLGTHRLTNRSMCLARMSTSTFSRRPTAASPSVVDCRVCGITATVKLDAPTAATVRLTPSSAIEPFSTT